MILIICTVITRVQSLRLVWKKSHLNARLSSEMKLKRGDRVSDKGRFLGEVKIAHLQKTQTQPQLLWANARLHSKADALLSLREVDIS